MNAFYDLINKRESCRSFNGKPVDKADVRTIIEAGRIAPSACNGQPWHFYAVTEDETKHALAGHMQAFNRKAGAFIVMVEDKRDLKEAIGSLVKRHDYAQIDMGIACAHMALAATSLGISNCIIGWFDESKVKETLHIPKRKRVRLILSLGYTDVTTLRKKTRKTYDDITTHID
jgi:nitroreductase